MQQQLAPHRDAAPLAEDPSSCTKCSSLQQQMNDATSRLRDSEQQITRLQSSLAIAQVCMIQRGCYLDNGVQPD